MSLTQEAVLAGPFLRYTNDCEVWVWLATRTPLLPGDLTLEVWDPAPQGWLSDYDPVSGAGGSSNPVALSNSIQSIQVCTHLFVHLLQAVPYRALNPKKVYAYRLSVPAEIPG